MRLAIEHIAAERSGAGSIRPTQPRALRNSGFSMFEMVAFIIVSAIVYSTAVNRFSEFPEAAERASFLAITTQLQSAINLEMIFGLTGSPETSVLNYANLNPMDLLLKAPNNYLGAFDQVSVERLPRRSWYFDSASNELVYLINEAQNTFLLVNSVEVPASEIRFRVFVTYRHPVTGQNVSAEELGDSGIGNARVSGVVLRPVIPYIWHSTQFFTEETFTAE